jgi:hypothetical protein
MPLRSSERAAEAKTLAAGDGSIGHGSLCSSGCAGASRCWPAPGSVFFRAVQRLADPAGEASRRETWTLLLLPVVLFPWIFWKTLWRALARHLRENLGTGFRLGLGLLLATGALGLAGGWKLQGMLPIAVPLSLLGARLLATQAIRPKDFHAVVPGFIALLLGLFFFLMNIIPTAHLDALWRQVFGMPLPIWLGGIGLASGLALLVIAYALAQMSPSQRSPTAGKPHR